MNDHNQITIDLVAKSDSLNASLQGVAKNIVSIKAETELLNKILAEMDRQWVQINKDSGAKDFLSKEVTATALKNGKELRAEFALLSDAVKDPVKVLNLLSDAVVKASGKGNSLEEFTNKLEKSARVVEKLKSRLEYKTAKSDGADKSIQEIKNLQNSLTTLQGQLSELRKIKNVLNSLSSTDKTEQATARYSAALAGNTRELIANAKAEVANADSTDRRTRSIELAERGLKSQIDSLKLLNTTQKAQEAELLAQRNQLLKANATSFKSQGAGADKGSYLNNQKAIQESYNLALAELRAYNDKAYRVLQLKIKREQDAERENVRILQDIRRAGQASTNVQSISNKVRLYEETFGKDSVKAIRARIVEEDTIAAKRHAEVLLEIERNLQTRLAGLRSSSARRAAVENANAARAEAINTFAQDTYTRQIQNHRDLQEAIERTSLRTRSLWERIGFITLAHKAWNLAINSTVQLLRDIPQSGIELQNTISALQASLAYNPKKDIIEPSKGLDRTYTALQFLQKEAERTGIAILTLEKNYRTFLASATLAGESVKTANRIFENTNTVITALHISGERAELIFLALAQMFNKGKIQSEELTKQLGNLLPGAFAAFAKAIGMTSGDLSKAMKKGQILATQNVDRFLQFYADRFKSAFATAQDGFNATLGRASTAYTNFTRSLFAITEPVLSGFTKLGTAIIKAFTLEDIVIVRLKNQISELGDFYETSFLKRAIDGWGVIIKLASDAGDIQKKARDEADETDRLANGGRPRLESIKSNFSNFTPKDRYDISFAELTSLSKALERSKQLEADISKDLSSKQNGTLIGNILRDDLTTQQKITASLKDRYELVKNIFAMEKQNYDAVKDVSGDEAENNTKLHEAFLKRERIINNAKVVRDEAIADLEADLARQKASGRLYKIPLTREGYRPKDSNDPRSADFGTEEQFAKARAKIESDYQAADAKYQKQKQQEEENLRRQKEQTQKLEDARLEAIQKQTDFIKETNQVGIDGLKVGEQQKALEEQIAGVRRKSAEELRADLAFREKEELRIFKELRDLNAGVGTGTSSGIPFGQFKADGKSPASINAIKNRIREIADQNNFSSDLLLGLIQTESSFNPNAVSSAGAQGLGQFIPATAARFGIKDPFNIDESVLGSIKYLKLLLKTFQDTRLAIAAYNAGEGAVQKYNNTIPPYKETQKYVKTVLARTAKFENEEVIGSEIQSAKSINKTTDALKAKRAELEAQLKTNQKLKELTQEALKYEDQTPSITNLSKAKKDIAKFNTKTSLNSEVLDDRSFESLGQQYNKLNSLIKTTETSYLAAAKAVDELTQKQKGLDFAINAGTTNKEIITQHKLVTEELLRQQTVLEEQKTQYGAITKEVGDLEKKLKNAFPNEVASISKDLDKQARQATKGDLALFYEDTLERLRQANANGTDFAKTEAQITAEADNLAKKWEYIQDLLAQKAIFDDLKNGFKSMLQGWINGTQSFAESFKSLFSNLINTVVNNAVNKFNTGLEKIISGIGTGGWSDIISSVVQIGVSYAVSSLRKSSQTTPVDPVYSNPQNRYLGSSAYFTTDTLVRNQSDLITSEAYRSFNSGLDFITSNIVKYGDTIAQGLVKIGDLVTGGSISTIIKPITNFFDSITSYAEKLVSTAIDYISTGAEAAVTAVTNILGITTSTVATAGAEAASSAASGTGSAAASVASEVIPVIGNIISVIKLGFSLADIAANDYLNTIEKVEAGLKEATIALALVIPPVAAVLHAINTSLQITDSISRNDGQGLVEAIAFGFAGDLGVWTENVLFGREIPSATLLSYPDKRPFNYQTDSNNKDFFTTKGPKSAGVGVDTPFGQLEYRYNDIKRVSWENARDSFKGLLETIQSYDASLGQAIKDVDKAYGDKNTLNLFAEKAKQFETEHDLESLSSAGQVFERLTKYIAPWLTATGTHAGVAAGNWINAFGSKIINSKNPSLGQSFNIEDFVAKNLNAISKLPEKLAGLFVKSVKGIDEGATQDQFIKEFEDFWKGWFTASVGLASLGTNISDTNVEEWLAALVDLNFKVNDAATNLVGYASALKGAGTYTKDTLNQLFNDLLTYTKSKGFDKSKTADFIATNILAGRQGTDIHSTFTTSSVNKLSQAMFDAATAATEQANAEIDVLITQEKLNNLTREQAIEQLRLAGKLDDAKIASANFSNSLIEQQKKFLESTSLVNNISILYGQTLSSIGVSLEGANNSGQNLITTLGDSAKAMDVFQTALTNFTSPLYAAQANKNISQASFDSASKVLGLDNYSLDQFAKDIVNPILAGGYLNLTSTEGKTADQITADTTRFNQITRLIQAGNDLYSSTTKLNEANKQSIIGSYNVSGQLVSSSSEVTNAFGSLRSAIESTRGSLLGALPQAASESQSLAFANTTLDDFFKNPMYANFLAQRGITRSNAVASFNNFVGSGSYNDVTALAHSAASYGASNPQFQIDWEGAVNAIQTINASYDKTAQDSSKTADEAAKKAEDAANKLKDLNSQLNLLGKSDIAKSIEQINQDVQGFVDVLGVTAETKALSRAKFQDLSKTYLDEFASFGKSDTQKSLDEISKWTSEMKAAVPDLASGLGLAQDQVSSFIDVLSNQRTITALRSVNSELQGFKDNIVDYVAKLKQSVLGSPIDQFQATQVDALKTYNLAKNYDKKALGEITSKADAYIQKIQDLYGNTDYGQSLIQQVSDSLAALPEQWNLSDYITAGSDAIVKEIQQLPNNLVAKNIELSTGVSPSLANFVLTPASSNLNLSISSKELDSNLGLLADKLEKVLAKLEQIRVSNNDNTADVINTDITIATNATKALINAIDSTKPKNVISLA